MPNTAAPRTTRLIAGTLCATLLVAACTSPAPETYPVTGQPCAPDDPVRRIDVGACRVPD